MRWVLDTSVVVSAVRSHSGASAELLQSALRRDFAMLLSSKLILEYESVLMRPDQLASSGFSISQIDELLSAILRVAEEVHPGTYFGPSSLDANDDHVLSLAMHGRADAIVTHNIKHFKAPAADLGISLYTAVEALRQLRR